MPLISLWKSNPEAIALLSIQQIVTNAGDGELRDHSLCSEELRAYLAGADTPQLATYAEQCLAQSYPKSGQVLQDVVNELGRRLDYNVENGRYAGVTGSIGFDGLWSFGSSPAIIVEVKTTDAYRLSLDTLIKYRTRLVEAGKCAGDASVLIVVGRQDTGELEAQIRGSRHAWDVRLISIESLVRLVSVKQSAGLDETDAKIRGLLRPAEYTRLDGLVDIVFSAVSDVEQEPTQPPDAEDNSNGSAPTVAAYDVTSSDDLATKRDRILAAWAKRTGTPLLKKSRAVFWSPDHSARIDCSLSKRYARPVGRPYWYAFHPGWDEFLGEGASGHFILGGMDLDRAFAVPIDVVRKLLPHLHTTEKPDGKSYWHIHIQEDSAGSFAIYVPGRGENLPLAEFAFAIE